MRLPDNVVIQSISDFCVCFFKDTKFHKDAPPHFYINVPIDDDSSLLLCIITSKIEKRKKHCAKANRKALKSLVYVDNKTLEFLSKESIVDCNEADIVNKIELQKRIDPKYKLKVIERNIPDNLKIQIVRAIKDSPLINEYIKKRLKP